MSSPARQSALCALLTAAAVTVMCLGTLVPAATYCCPLLAGLAVALARPRVCARNLWLMYGAISVLSLILSPDKEAALLFLALGYYPIVRPALEKKKPLVRWCAKLALFCLCTAGVYALLLFVVRPAELAAEMDAMTELSAALLLLLGGVVFVLYDRLLAVLDRRLGR